MSINFKNIFRLPRPSFGPSLIVTLLATTAMVVFGVITLEAFRNGNWLITISAGAVAGMLYLWIGLVTYRYRREQVRRYGRWWPLWKK